jgi:long-subunit acyl-CoA synthetase (AMP-forming)
VQRAIDAGNAHLTCVEQVKRLAIAPGEWLPGDDELTPTSRPKREPSAERCAAQMDALYS